MTLSWFNPQQIVADHVTSFQDNGKYHVGDVVAYFGLPLLFSTLLVAAGTTLADSMVNILITSMSILAGLLFNLLILVYDIVCRSARSSEERPDLLELRRVVLRETFANISFAIFVSISIVILILADRFIASWISFLSVVFSFIVFYLVALFILTLMMILKRVHILLSRQFAEAGTGDDAGG